MEHSRCNNEIVLEYQDMSPLYAANAAQHYFIFDCVFLTQEFCYNSELDISPSRRSAVVRQYSQCEPTQTVLITLETRLSRKTLADCMNNEHVITHGPRLGGIIALDELSGSATMLSSKF